MAETYTGEVRNGVIVFDEGTPPLAEGTKVRVEAEPSSDLANIPVADDRMAPTRAWLLAMAREAEADPDSRSHPADLAEQHDHYAHGKPRP